MTGKFGFSKVKTSDNMNQYTFNNVKENKWNVSVGYQITPNTIWNISFSNIDGNSSYLKNSSTQFLMGFSAALVPMKK